MRLLAETASGAVTVECYPTDDSLKVFVVKEPEKIDLPGWRTAKLFTDDGRFVCEFDVAQLVLEYQPDTDAGWLIVREE